ncbi:cell division protein FtsQ [Achromobacter deleyi]|nr:cell division protein FtsQ [Achromobacter deleyi]
MQTQTPARTPSHRKSAFFFGALLTIGLICGVAESVRADLGSMNARAWIDGTAGAKLNAALVLPWRDKLETIDASWRYRFLGQLGPQVQEGCPGWLFYADGIRPPVADAESIVARRIELMQQLAKQLEAAKVQLLVVTVPDKSRIESDALCGLSRPGAMTGRLPQWQQALQAGGVAHVDLTDPLQAAAAPFYRTDVHLNQNGAALAAQTVAAAALPLVGAKGDQRYTVESAAAEKQRIGDLLILAGLEHAPAQWRPAPDVEIPQKFQLAASGGLLDEGPAVQVLLAGSSNSRRSNFAEQLGQSLGQQVWNVSRDGGKFADALMLALQNQATWPKSLRLVIWEMSEMSLVQPLSEEELAALRKTAIAAS